jgi:hypothetical protein
MHEMDEEETVPIVRPKTARPSFSSLEQQQEEEETFVFEVEEE